MSNDRDDIENDDEGLDEGQDSPVIRELRDQVKALTKENKATKEAAAKAAEEARSQVMREVTAREVVNALGFPKLAPLVVENVQGDINEDAVRAYLDGLGLLGGDEEQSGDDVEASEPQEDLGGVASLGQRVASAASGSVSKSVAERLEKAESPAEVEAIAREAGFYQDT